MAHHYNAQMIPAIISSFKALFYVLDPYMDDAMRHHAKLLEQALVDHNTEVAAAIAELTMQRDTAETSLALTDLKVSMKDFGLRQLKREIEEQAAAHAEANRQAAERFAGVLGKLSEEKAAANDTAAKLRAENEGLTRKLQQFADYIKDGDQPATASEPPPVERSAE